VFPLASSDPKKIGQFTVVARLGSGGMGTVYLATRARQRVALKVLSNALLSDPGARLRLSREAETLEKLSSPYIARLVDWRVSEEEAWLSLTFINGDNLRDLVLQNGPLPEPTWWALAAGVLEALKVSHQKEVVHRDIKPSNIVMSHDGPVVIDFGISQGIDATRLTSTGGFQGSPAWLSPEQLEIENVGTLSDIYSLASTLVFAATGQSPWGPEGSLTVPVLFSRILANKPDLSGLSPQQVEFLTPLFSADPESRPSAAALLEITGPCDSTLFKEEHFTTNPTQDSDAQGDEPEPADADFTEIIQQDQTVLGELPATQALQVEDIPATPKRSPQADASETPAETLISTEEQQPRARMEEHPTASEKNPGKEETEAIGDEATTASTGQRTKRLPRKKNPEDSTPTVVLPRQQPSPDKDVGSRDKAVKTKQKSAPKPVITNRPRQPRSQKLSPRLIAPLALGVVIALVAPLWWLATASPFATGRNQPSGMVLEWLDGNLYGQPVSKLGEVLGPFYTVGSFSITRISCVVEETGELLRDPNNTPLFETQDRRGTWVEVGNTIIGQTGTLASDPCSSDSPVAITTSVERETLAENLNGSECLIMRYREPQTEQFLEREERWCVWLDSAPPGGAPLLR